jgi:c-di-GMP-related signal transduction protein
MGDAIRNDVPDLRDLASRFPLSGLIQAIYLRPQRRADVQSVAHAVAIAACALHGDHHASRSTIALGHALGFAVVAEGIETEADLAWLHESGCDIGQGYFIARPLEAARIFRLGQHEQNTRFLGLRQVSNKPDAVQRLQGLARFQPMPWQ